MIMELTVILASIAFIIAMGIGFIAGGLFQEIKHDYEEINKQVDTMNEIIGMLSKENAKLRTMNNRSAKTDDENKKDM